MMLGERTAAWAKSGYTAKDYVQDGLIAMWDGIENAGWGVHDPSLLSWKNLVSGPDLTIDAATWADDSLVSIGSGGYAATGEAVAGIGHIEVCIRCDTPFNDSINRVVASFGYRFEIGVSLQKNNGLLFHGGYNAWSYDFGNKNMSISKANNTSVNPTINGSVILSRGPSDTWTYFGSGIFLGDYTTFLRGFVGSYYSIRLYSRALTAEEIAANYAIDKARFNLP